MHNFIAIRVDVFPLWTRPALESYNISNDGLYYLMPAYNQDGDIVHSPDYIKSKLNVENIEDALTYLTDPQNSYTMTYEEVISARNDPESIWFKE